MQYVNPATPGVSANQFGAGLGGFQDGNPATGTQGTEFVADFWNDLLGNLMNVLTVAGVAPTPDRPADLSDAIKAIATPVGHGQCQLQYVSNVALTLAPMNGSFIRVAGKTYVIPAAGVAIPNAGLMVSGVAASNLAASTTYLVFVCDDGHGNLIPDCWPLAGGYVMDTTAGNIGVMVRKNGAAIDNTRTLVGMVATDAGSHFNDTDGLRLTRSWFNRARMRSRAALGSNTSTTSTTLIELSTGMRSSFLVWAGEDVAFWTTGNTETSAGTVAVTTIGFDGTAPEEEATAGGAGPSDIGTSSCGLYGLKQGLTEGQHYVTVLVCCQAGATSTWYSALSTTTAPLTLGIELR